MGRDLSFFAEVVTTGRVLGVDASSTPDEVARALGEYAENTGGDVMWQDYGVVEFHWERTSGMALWQGTHVSIQVHRLSGDPTWMNAAVRQAYGEFPTRLRFDDLRKQLNQAHCQLVEVPRQPRDVREYAYPARAVSILIATPEADTGLNDGDVYSIHCGNRARGMGYAGPAVPSQID
jgi:hypothetical protein